MKLIKANKTSIYVACSLWNALRLQPYIISEQIRGNWDLSQSRKERSKAPVSIFQEKPDSLSEPQLSLH